MYSTSGPALAYGDVNGDNIKDIFVGGAKGQLGELFMQDQKGKFTPKEQRDFILDAGSETVDALFFDKDQDGDLDLYTVSGGYEFAPKDKLLKDQIYENEGRGNFKKVTTALPEFFSSGSCVRASDIDGDGDVDLFVGGRIIPGRYPETPESFILINDGKGNFKIDTERVAPELRKIGMVTDAIWLDLNKDNQSDLIVLGEWMPVTFFINENGKLKNKTIEYVKDSTRGWWNCITAADIELDGDQDLILGNFGLNNQMKPTLAEPVSMLYSDIDNNR